MTVPNQFGTATSAIPLSQLDANFDTPIILGNTSIQLGNTVTTLNNMTLANVTISSGNVTITNVGITNANVSGTANISTLVVVGNATVGGNTTITGNITAANANVTTNLVLSGGTANGVAYLNTNKVLTTGSALVFDGTSLVGTAKFQSQIMRIKDASYSELYFSTTDAGGAPGALSYEHSSNSLRIYVNSGIKTVIDSSGNLGIGTTSPARKLHVDGGGSATYIQLSNTASGSTNADGFQLTQDGVNCGLINREAGYMSFDTSNIERARIDSSGNLLVGATSTRGGAKLDIRSDTSIAIGSNATYYGTIGYSAGAGLLSIAAETGGGINFLAGATERARIDSSGNLLVNTTSAVTTTVGSRLMYGATDPYISSTLTSSSDATTSYLLYSTGAGAYRFYVGLGGTIFATSIVITAISDQRLKENIRDIDAGLDEIMALKPRRFDWKEGKGQDKKNVAGFIAQEFEDVFPECVSTSKAGEDGIEYKNINHETLIPTLVKAIQELKAEFDAYKASHP